MLYLHVSNRTENLLRHLVEIITVSERSVFEKEYFLIQSQGMERMISQTLAKSFTSWCNFQFTLPLEFIRYSAAQLGMEVTPDGFDRKIMIWRIEELLRDLDDDDFQLVQRYLQGDNPELKRYQLAEQLANIFDQYQLMRPEMLAAWDDGREVLQHPAEKWQKKLWRRLTGDQAGGIHRGVLLQELITRLKAGGDYSSILPRRLSVFGLTIMPPLFLAYLQGLARHSDVHLYVLSPCREFWGEIESRRKVLQEAIRAAKNDRQPDTTVGIAHPLLVSLGQQGKDFQRLLSDDIGVELEFASYEEPGNDNDPRLLHKLQSDILHGEVRSTGGPWPKDDSSITIISCHTKLREISVLRQHILRLLYEDPELSLRDIVVMAPDIQEYGALIPALFDDIQHSISDRSLKKRNPLLAAFTNFLTLLQGRFGWEEVLDLLKDPAIADTLHLSLTDLENIEEWVSRSGIRWGLSANHRNSLGLPEFAESSWRAGIERLLMGYAIDSEDFIDGVLPFPDVEGSGALALGGLCRFLDILERAKNDCVYPRTLEKWAALLLHYAELLFIEEGERSSDSREMLEVLEIFTDLAGQPGRYHKVEVEFSVISAWLEHTAGETRSSSGFLRGQLTFCSMLPMRSIPFECVCIIGLNDGDFPKDDRWATFDLMATSHKPGDRSRRMDDRYQFLEALMAARKNLYLSYIGQSITTNEEIPPSVVITELLELLEDGYGAENLTKHHPLHPFSSRYFDRKDSQLFSYDRQYCKVAKRLQLPTTSGSPWWDGQQPAEIIEIQLVDLFRFFQHPQRWFVQHCLGIKISDDIEGGDESETFQPQGLDRYLIDQELLELLLADMDAGDQLQKLRASGRWPLGMPGNMSFAEKISELKIFIQKIDLLEMGSRREDIPVDIEVAGYRLLGDLGNVYDSGILLYRYSDFKGRDLLAGWLHHLIYQRLDSAVPTSLLSKDGFYRFEADAPCLPDLESCVELFVNGCRQPSPLYIEPGLAWVKKANMGQGMRGAALQKLTTILESGYDAETELLLRNCDLHAVLDEQFEEMCMTILQPIWSNRHGH